MNALGIALLGMGKDDNIGCIVGTGNAKAFAAGADIRAIQHMSYVRAVLRLIMHAAQNPR